MRARDQFDFDGIACPNTFEDDPEVDAFFDRIIQCSRREMLRKTALFKKGQCLFLNANSSSKSRLISLTEAAKKNIQKRSQSLREKFSPQKKPAKSSKPVKVEIEVEKKKVAHVEQVTPLSQVGSRPPNVPPRTRRGTTKPKAARDETVSKQESIKRHAWGRWSFPPADPLTYSVDPEDAKPAQTTPLRSKKIDKTASGIWNNTQSCVTPKRKKSVAKATKIRFEPRDSLRKMSIRKSIAKKMKPSRIPIPRNPYAHVKSRVGEVFRSVPLKKAKYEVQPTCVPSKALKRATEKNIVHPRNPNPVGKTLAQLVHEFQKSPRKYSKKSSNSNDNRVAWKSYF